MPDDLEKDVPDGEDKDAPVPDDGEVLEGQAEPDGEDTNEAEGEEGPDEVVDEPRPRKRTAAERIQTLARAREEDRQRHQREIDDLRREIQQPRQRQETPEEESARMALMTPDERMDYRLGKSERQHREQMQALAFQTAETTDQTAFRTEIRANPALQRYEAEVEEVLATIRRKGWNLPRMEVLHNVIGKAAMARMGKGGKQAERGAKNISRQTTTPVNGRGDVQTQRGKRGSTPRDRLDGVQI